MSGLLRGSLVVTVVAAALALLSGAAPARTSFERAPQIEVVVTLAAPPLAQVSTGGRTPFASAARRGRLNLRAPASVDYLRRLDAAQRVVEHRIETAIAGSHVRWRYGVVLNGFAVALPASSAERLRSVPGVDRVYPSVSYRSRLDRSPGQIGAPSLWGPNLETAGNGVKIGVIDDGVDQTHTFFDPSSFSMPAGFPKGNAAFTTAKVIAARAFAPPSPSYRNASLPFDPEESEHATHVAGIAAGNRSTVASSFPGRPRVSGVAPRAYLGNYKVLTIPIPIGGLNGNSPEIVAGIEAAVRDGMDVINLSLGEVEIAPSQDVVVRAINAAADAGVVPAIAAGNDFGQFGRGSVGSPGSAEKAITAAAVTSPRNGTANVVTGFSSSGPTPVSLQLKPDVSAPGAGILSSVPTRVGSWAIFNGTSMASPHVAGAAALLRQRHPEWTVQQLKSALVQTGDPAFAEAGRSAEAPTTREGGGVVNLVRADRPLLFAIPSSAGFGLLRPRARASRTVALTDAGGGTGTWSVLVAPQAGGPSVPISVPPTVAVPGPLQLSISLLAGIGEGEVTGFVVLARNGERRRIPYWLHVERPRLALHRKRGVLRRSGTYAGNTRGQQSLVSAYRYPDDPAPSGIPTRLAGPEQVFRLRLARAVTNFGVAILAQAQGVQVEPRIVFAGDENHLVGYPGLPLNLNPYTRGFGRREPVAGAVRPERGLYDIVFDTTGRARAGRFTFRFWVDDRTPPAVRLVTPTSSGGRLTLSVVDRGAGVDPRTLSATVDGTPVGARFDRRRARVILSVGSLGGGEHRLVLEVADYQETKNNENVLRILPNTTVFRATFRAA
jgi:subtilisin family serine protease